MEKQKLIIILVVLLCGSLAAVGYFATTKSKTSVSAEQVQLDLEKAQGELTQVRVDLEKTQIQLADSRAKLAFETNQIKVLQTKLAQKEGLSKATDDLNKQLQGFEGKLQASAAKSKDLQNELSTVKSQIAELNGQLSAAQQQVSDLKKQRQAAMKRTKTLSTKNEQLQQKVEDLTTRLEQKKKVAKRAAERAAKKSKATPLTAKADLMENVKVAQADSPEGWGSPSRNLDGELAIDVDFTWVSKYMWRGQDLMGGHASFQPSVNIDLWGSGFSFNWWAALPGSSGSRGLSTVNATEYNYSITYSDSFLEGDSLQTDYAASYIYYDFPVVSSEVADAQEMQLALSWPKICPAGVTPSYTYAQLWPAYGGGAAKGNGGAYHIFGLEYEDNSMALPLTYSWDITFNDSAYEADSDWSHMVFGLATSMDIGPGTLSPGLFYQVAFEDKAADRNDEFWSGFSYTISF